MLKHTVAQLMGRLSNLLSGLLVSTLVANHYGASALGVYGVYLLFQTFIGMLDMGMSTAINKAVATTPQTERYKVLGLMRAFESVSFCNAALFSAVCFALFPFFLHQWDSPFLAGLPLGSISAISASALFFRYSQSLYANAIFGTGQHIRANAISSFMAIARLLIVWFGVNGNWLLFETLFLVHAIIACLELLVLVAMCRTLGVWRLRVLPDWSQFRAQLSFLLPIFAFTLTGILSSQMDRLIFSRFMTLEAFGSYALVATYASGLSSLAYAATNVFYPKASAFFLQKDWSKLAASLQEAMQYIFTLVLPAASWAIFFGQDILVHIISDKVVLMGTSYFWAPLFLSGAFYLPSLLPHIMFYAMHHPEWNLRINLMNLLIAPLLYLGALLFFDIRVAVYAIPLAALVSTHLFLARLRRECPETNETMLLSLLRGAKMLLLFVLLFAAASLLMQWLGIVGHARLWLALGLAALVGGGCLYDLRRGLKLGRLST